MKFAGVLSGDLKWNVSLAVEILSLALGIATNVTVFSLVREMILDDVSGRHSEQLASVEGANVSYTAYRDLQQAAPFQDLAY